MRIHLHVTLALVLAVSPAAGDVVVQNGTAHAWYNGGEEGAVLAAVMVGGRP